MKVSILFGIIGFLVALLAVLTVKHDSAFVLAVPVALIAAVIMSFVCGRRTYGEKSLKAVVIPNLPFTVVTIASAFLLQAWLGA